MLRLNATNIIFTLSTTPLIINVERAMAYMLFGDKVKLEREKRGWSQDYLAEMLYVSRQSISKWETNKNYPGIEVIIDLSDIFDITLDELLRSDEELEEKVIQDSKKRSGWVDFILAFLGALMGVILVHLLEYGEILWGSLGEPIGFLVLLSFIYVVLRKGIQKVEKQKD